MHDHKGLQVTVEAPIPAVRLIRVAGRLDRAAAASVLRLVSVQLDLIARRHQAVTDLVLDIEQVRSFEPGGLESLRHAPYTAGQRGIGVCLSGCGGDRPALRPAARPRSRPGRPGPRRSRTPLPARPAARRRGARRVLRHRLAELHGQPTWTPVEPAWAAPSRREIDTTLRGALAREPPQPCTALRVVAGENAPPPDYPGRRGWTGLASPGASPNTDEPGSATLPTQRRLHETDQLGADQDALRAAATWVREQPARSEVAALSEPATAALCARLLDHVADYCERLDDATRRHVVRVAHELTGERMDRPVVRRTRRG